MRFVYLLVLGVLSLIVSQKFVASLLPMLSGHISSFDSFANIGYFAAVFLFLSGISLFPGLLLAGHFQKNNHPHRIALAAPLGFTFHLLIWSLALTFRVPPYGALMLGISSIAAAGLFFVQKTGAKEPLLPAAGRYTAADIIAPLAAALVVFFLVGHVMKDNFVFGSWDANTPGFYEFMIRINRKYPMVKPFIDDTLIHADYITAMSSLNIVVADILRIPLEKAQMANVVVIACFSAIVVYILSFELTGERVLSALSGTMLASHAYRYAIRDGEMPEQLALFCVVLSLLLIPMALDDDSPAVRTMAGCTVGLAFLSHPREAIPLMSGVGVFVVMLPFCRGFQMKKDIGRLLFIIIVAALASIPWYLDTTSGTRAFEKAMYNQSVLNVYKSLSHYHLVIPVFLMSAGAVAAIWMRTRASIMLVAYAFGALLAMNYWILLMPFRFKWFSINKIQPDTAYLSGAVTGYFTTPFFYLATEFIPRFSFSAIMPALAAAAMFPFIKVSQKYRLERLFNARGAAILFLFVVWVPQFCAFFIGGAGEYMNKDDYAVLKQIGQITDEQTTLILNVPTPGFEPYFAPESNWAGIVSGRRVVFWKPPGFIKFPATSIDWDKAKWAYANLDKEEARRFLARNKITHVFLPRNLSPDFGRAFDNNKYLSRIIKSETGDKFSAVYEVRL